MLKLKGKKTYLAAAGAVLSAGGAYLAGEATVVQAAQLAFTGILSATLRAGVSKVG